MTLARAGRLEEAVAANRAALKLAPDDVGVQNNLAVVVARIGQLEEAIELFQRALTFDPEAVEVRVNLQGSQRQLVMKQDQYPWRLAVHPDPLARDPDEAVLLAESLANQLGKDNILVLDLLAASWAGKGDFSQAIRYAEKAKQLVTE